MVVLASDYGGPLWAVKRHYAMFGGGDNGLDSSALLTLGNFKLPLLKTALWWQREGSSKTLTASSIVHWPQGQVILGQLIRGNMC